MDKEYIIYLLQTGGYSIISESTGKMIRDIGNGIEVFDAGQYVYDGSLPSRVFGNYNKAYNYFES